MSLSLECRPCGKVYVIRCVGRIVTGEEATTLQAAFNRGVLEFKQLVLDFSQVTRLDSTGMGLLVRFLWHARNRNGDVRLATPTEAITHLLKMTKLDSVFRIYPNQEAAIVSYLKEGVMTPSEAAATGPRVLFLDPSPDTCAFVRTLLARNGYRVLSTGLMGDAKILLNASTVDIIVLGPESGALAAPAMLDVLQKLAPSAKTVVLEPEFKSRAADEAGIALLKRIQLRTTV